MEICAGVQLAGLPAHARQPGAAEQLPLASECGTETGSAVIMQPVCQLS